MTSKNLFFNLIKEDFRRRLWTFILSALVFFATFMVAFTMLIQNYVSRYSRASYGFTKAEFIEHISGNLCSDFYGFFWWFVLVAVVGAVICGMSGFAYLHSRKQMDFYHSLPVKREMIFAVRLINGVLIYTVPYLVGLLYTYLLCTIYGVMTTDIFFCSLFFFVVHLMGYLVMYLGTIIAMMLTGKMVIAFFGICAINLYVPAVYALITAIQNEFFVTMYNSSSELGFRLTKWLSPASYYYHLLEDCTAEESRFWLEFLLFVVYAAVLVVLALVLYKKRASEKADTAMSFKVTEPVFRVLISIPVGILTGMLFYVIQYDNNSGVFWIVFGGLFGGFLAHGIMEALYNGDIRKCLSHKVQMLACMAVAAVAPLLFLYDVFGYDSYIPEKKEIASMSLSSSEMRFAGGYYDEDGWVSTTEYALENGKVTNFDAMYELAEILVEDAAATRSEQFFNVMGTRASYVGYEDYHSADFTIQYQLKDGSEVTRSYDYNFYAVQDILERIYENPEFKKITHPIFSLMEAGYEPIYIACEAPTVALSMQFEKNCELILETYAEEVLNLTFDELKNTAAIGEVLIRFMVGKENRYEDTMNFLVYPSMTRTIALLKEQGYQMTSLADSNLVDSITVYYSGTMGEIKEMLGQEVSMEWQEIKEGAAAIGADAEEVDMYYEKLGYYPYYEETVEPETWYYEGVSVTFTDPTELETLKQILIYNPYKSEFGPFPVVTNRLNADVYFEVGKGSVAESDVIGWTNSYRFLEDSIPEFVLERILDKMLYGEQTKVE